MKKQIAMKLPFASSLLTLALTASLVPSFAVAKGGKDGGGADYIQNTQAWFMSTDATKKIRACAEIAPGFSVPKDEVLASVRFGFQKWADYLGRTGLNEGSYVGTRLASGEYRSYKGVRIVTQLDVVLGCKGGEDLRLYFGVNNSDIANRKKHYQVPFAFSETDKSVDPDGPAVLWSKGMIWIAPDKSVLPQYQVPTWNMQEYHPFRQLLIHEFGHVFGVGHIDGTFMGMRLMNDLAERTQYPQSGRTGNYYDKRDLEIEQYSELYFGLNFETDMILPQGQEEATFKRLVGRVAVGKVRVHAKWARIPGHVVPQPGSQALSDINITLTDNQGSTTVMLREKMKLAENRNRAAKVFYTPFMSYDFMAKSYAGTLVTATGEELSVVSNYNQNYSRYEIRDLSRMNDADDMGNNYPLMVSD